MRLCSKEYFTKKATPRKSARPPIHAKSFAPMNCSQSIGGLIGIAACRSFASMRAWGIGGGSNSLGASRTAAGAVTGSGGGIAVEGDTGAPGFAREALCRRASSTDESRASKSSTVRFAAFALAMATNGSTTIKIKKAMRRRIKGSICLLDLAAYSGFGQDDTRFARRLLIDKNLGIHRLFRS